MPGISLVRRLAATTTGGALVVLVATDVWVPAARSWWDRRSFTTDVVSSLLVLAVTVLIIDEVVAHRQRKDRAVSVAVQGLIVYSQAAHACELVVAGLDGSNGGEAYLAEARDGVRNLANMILIASPSLFDDREARLFLEEVQRLAALLYGAAALAPASLAPSRRDGDDVSLARIKVSRSRLDARVGPLAARLPLRDRSPLSEALGDTTAAPGPQKAT